MANWTEPQWGDFIRAMGQLVGSLAWPVAALGIAYILREEIRRLIGRIEEMTVASGHTSVSLKAKRKRVEKEATEKASAPYAIYADLISALLPQPDEDD